jgi:hypothetical protein
VPSLEGVHTAWEWLTLLSCTAIQTRLPAAALQLLNDLVQLLFYHTEQAGTSSDGHPTGEKTQVGHPAKPLLDGHGIHMTLANMLLTCGL